MLLTHKWRRYAIICHVVGVAVVAVVVVVVAVVVAIVVVVIVFSIDKEVFEAKNFWKFIWISHLKYYTEDHFEGVFIAYLSRLL